MKRRDLFSSPVNEEKKPALCGFVPMDGWPHKWARPAHLEGCQDCLVKKVKEKR